MASLTIPKKMASLSELEKELAAVKERNRKVEMDKAWEISWVRRIIIAVLTYIVIILFFIVAGLPKPFVNSLVPTAGFILSTLSLVWFKGLWMKHHG